MPKDTGAPFFVPYNDQDDSPANLEAITKPMAERVHELLGEIGLDQLLVPGGSADDGKLLIVKDGTAALQAMKGDGTIDEEGNFQLGAKVVGTAELGDKAVGTGQLNDKSITLGKLVDGLGVTDGFVAAANKDGAAGTPSLRTLGAGGKQAAAGNDPRLSDERVPLDGSVTESKMGDGIVPRKKLASASFKTARVEVEVGAASSALVTIPWGSEFADTNYTIAPSIHQAVGSTSAGLVLMRIDAIEKSQIKVLLKNEASSAKKGTVHAMAWHD